MAQVLVTGGNGFIGRSLCGALLRNGFCVRATFRTSKPEDKAEIEWVRKDLTDDDGFSELLTDCEYVVHLAALAHQIGKVVVASEFDRINHQITADLARSIAASPTRRRLVFVSSIGAVCSGSNRVITQGTECRPDTDYGRSKHAAELAIHRILSSGPSDWCILRPTLVYGPGNPGNMLRLMRLVRFPIPLPLGGIRNRRTFLYVENLVDVILKALTHPGASRQTFNVADSEVLSTPDLIRELARLSGRPSRMVSLPGWTLRVMGKAGDLFGSMAGRPMPIDTNSIDRLIGSLEVDNSFVRSTLDWSPRFSTREGLQQTLNSSRPVSDSFHASEAGAVSR